MNESDDVKPPVEAAEAEPAPQPRRRAPARKKAAAGEAAAPAAPVASAEGAEAVAPAKTRARRSKAAVAAAESGEAAAVPVSEAAPAPAETASAPAPRRARAPRKAASGAEAVPTEALAPVVSTPECVPPVAEEPVAPASEAIVAAPIAAAETEEAVPSSVVDDDDEEDDSTDAGVAFVIEEVPEVVAPDAGELFAEVVAGTYDAETEPEAAEESAEESTKRVLRPEPDAPKLQKVLAQAGIGSRRDMEQLIADGQVMVNGQPANIGMRIVHGDQIKIAGKVIKVRIAPPPARVLAYHKPVGEVVTHHDPEGRPTVFRRLPRLQQGRWLSVGRLDINTEGLLLFTNSGDLANQLMHPRFGVEREYAVRVLGTLELEAKQRLLDGVDIEGQKAAFRAIEDGGGEGINHWYRVVITEGRNREVRKLFDAVGLTVSRLIRIRYGTVVLPRGLKRGVWVELDENDVRLIRQLASPGRGDRAPQGARGERGDQRGERGPRQDRNRRGGKGPRERERLEGGVGGAPREPGVEGQFGPRQGPQGQPQGQGQGQGDKRGRNNRGERRDGPPRDARPPQPPREGKPQREPRPQRDEDDDIPLRIPNPLEQTFDRRFATGSKRITAGFGRPTEEGDRPQGGQRGQKGGPRQPDPMQTSVGYIGADAYFTRPGGGKGGKGGRRR